MLRKFRWFAFFPTVTTALVATACTGDERLGQPSTAEGARGNDNNAGRCGSSQGGVGTQGGTGGTGNHNGSAGCSGGNGGAVAGTGTGGNAGSDPVAASCCPRPAFIEPSAEDAFHDETGFFSNLPATLAAVDNCWRLANLAVSVDVCFDTAQGGLYLSQITDVERDVAHLAEPSPLLELDAPNGNRLLTLGSGWVFSEAKFEAGSGPARLMVTLEAESTSALASAPLEARVVVQVFAGDEPYVTVEPYLYGDFVEQAHVGMVHYAQLALNRTLEDRPFGRYSNHHVLAPVAVPVGSGGAGGAGNSAGNGGGGGSLNPTEPAGLWVSIGNYNADIALTDNTLTVAAEANAYLDHYLPLTNGSLGTWMFGVHGESDDAARYDYQLFLQKHWIAGSHRSIPPHVHDYWYSTRRTVTESQPERLAPLAPLTVDSGFHFFWLIYDQHEVWPNWELSPPEYWPGQLDPTVPGSVTSIMNAEGVRLGLYTAPNRKGWSERFHLQLEKSEEYGDLLGRRAAQAKAATFWYEDKPGENYTYDVGLPHQPPGNISWMWRQGFLKARNALLARSPTTAMCRTWVDFPEQLGWAECCSALDVRGSRGGNMSGGSTLAADYSLADNWRRKVWELVPIWPLMNHIGHHPVHIRDSSRTIAASHYIDSSAAMMGPFALNGPLGSTTADERAVHCDWSNFSWVHREQLRYAFRPRFLDSPGPVDGIYHLTNANESGLCGFVGLWNRSSSSEQEITLVVPLDEMRLRWDSEFEAIPMNGEPEIPTSIEPGEAILGPFIMPERSWQVFRIECG